MLQIRNWESLLSGWKQLRTKCGALSDLFVTDALHQFKVEHLASGCASSFKRVCFRFSVYSSWEWNAMATWNGPYCKLWSGQDSAALSKFQTGLRAELKLKYYFWQYITMVSFPFHQNKMPQSWRAVSQVRDKTDIVHLLLLLPFFLSFFFVFCFFVLVVI